MVNDYQKAKKEFQFFKVVIFRTARGQITLDRSKMC